MNVQNDNLVESMYRGVRRATEAQIKLQREMFAGWARLWPGLANRVSGPVPTIQKLQTQWSNVFEDMAGFQWDLLDNQFNFTLDSLRWVWGKNGEDAVVTTVERGRAPESKVELPSTPAPQIPVAELRAEAARNIREKVAVVTGAASGIGEAVARELADRGAKAVLLIDRNPAAEEVATAINQRAGRQVATAQIGDSTDQVFRKRVFTDAAANFGPVTICVPAAGITRDGLSVRIDKETGKAVVYPLETFRQVTEVNLLAPIYWGMEMVAQIAEDRRNRGLGRWEPEEETQGVIVFLGSVSSQGNKGQIAYAVAKAGLEGAAATMQKEAIYHGVRCGVIHPGFTDTPMVRALGADYLKEYVLPYTQLRRLIRPEEIADAICFMICNSAVSGELWADAGWHPPA
jgi:NAD(P)-dependent dehydrogenase (short-subunit alcohol dehydrogenase family)